MQTLSNFDYKVTIPTKKKHFLYDLLFILLVQLCTIWNLIFFFKCKNSTSCNRRGTTSQVQTRATFEKPLQPFATFCKPHAPFCKRKSHEMSVQPGCICKCNLLQSCTTFVQRFATMCNDLQPFATFVQLFSTMCKPRANLVQTSCKLCATTSDIAWATLSVQPGRYCRCYLFATMCNLCVTIICASFCNLFCRQS